MIYHKLGEQFMAFGDEGTDLSDLGDTVKATVKALRKHADKFDSIVVTGVSGLLVGPAVACFLKKPVAVVRKPHDDSHNGATAVVNAPSMGRRVLFLDDFTAGGATYRRVREQVAIHGRGARVTHTFYYRDQDFTQAEKSI